MKLTEKGMMLFIALSYIVVNILFYNTIFKNYPNIVLLGVSFLLCIIEILFWLVLFSVSDNKGVLIRNRTIESSFLIILSGVGISRIFLYSSPYLNDLISTNTFFIYLVGIFRVAFIFISIMNMFYLKDSKSGILFIISIFNLITAIFIWLEFDNNINAVIKIIAGLVFLIYIIKAEKNYDIKKKDSNIKNNTKIVKEEK